MKTPNQTQGKFNYNTNISRLHDTTTKYEDHGSVKLSPSMNNYTILSKMTQNRQSQGQTSQESKSVTTSYKYNMTYLLKS